ncbi:MAG: hypothetical protein MUP22_13135 [Desulfobacterales bacterium]|nr:hypothetical protein [Desulfobacterales bacterium]
MVFIVYTSSTSNSAKLQSIIEPLVSEKQVETYCSIIELKQRLQQPRREELVGIFMPSSDEDLSNLLSINHLVRDIRIILVLPDRNEKTISIGHSLRPRFLTYADGDLSDVTAVMNKMMGNPGAEPRQRGEVYA